MHRIAGDKVVMVDIDDTLILWDVSDHIHSPMECVEFGGNSIRFVRHNKNYNTLMKFVKLGYTIVVWSGSGVDWADTIVRYFGIEDMVHAVMSKPSWYFDDKPCQSWMGPRIWRDPHTGEEVA